MSKRKDKSLAVPSAEGEETVSVQIRKPLMDAVNQMLADWGARDTREEDLKPREGNDAPR